MVDENIFAALAPSPAGKELKPMFCFELSPPLIQNILSLLVPALMMGEHQESLN